ncbi:MAG: tRNA lysidine(34) synthetase TilS [Deltaproteobacteria bacterium]|nr:tRNA lysidine(34) synthetase TilS [Deltaproteobacteria bacterium]
MGLRHSLQGERGRRRVKKIFLDKRVWRDSKDNWVSVESNPKLKVTKQNIYGRCLPCITNLYRQLQEDREEIERRKRDVSNHCGAEHSRNRFGR